MAAVVEDCGRSEASVSTADTSTLAACAVACEPVGKAMTASMATVGVGSEASVSTADTSRFAASVWASSGEPAGAAAVLEAALGAWRAFQPESYVVASEALSPAVLRDIAGRAPGNKDSRQTLDLLADVFMPATGNDLQPIFRRMLRPRGGQVHFLHFWRAFAEVARLLSNLSCDSCIPKDGDQLGGPNRALFEEVELVRDTVLRTLDASAEVGGRICVSYSDQRLSAEDLARLMQEAASMSMVPAFWVSHEQSLSKVKRSGRNDSFLWDDVAALAMSWSRDAAAWRPAKGGFRKSSTGKSASSSSLAGGLPVHIHIYDVSHEDNVHKLNRVLAHKRNPLKFGGIFHAGVEVNGLEWSFGMSCSDTVPGISCCLPKEHSEHRFRETVRLRSTKLSAEEVADLIAQMIEAYPGDDYDMLRRNCCHFADDFVRRLGAGRLPGWVHRLARVGAFVDGAMMRIANRSLLPDDDDFF